MPEDPPLVNIKVTNPVTYFKAWWKRVMAGEGIDFRFKIHPVTAILMTLAIAGAGFGLGRITIPDNWLLARFVKPVETSKPTAKLETDDWRETALTGTLKSGSQGRYYLVTRSTEAVTLEVPEMVDLTRYIEKRILAAGNYSAKAHTLIVSDVLDLEVLPQKPITVIPETPLPTLTPTIIPSESPIPTP